MLETELREGVWLNSFKQYAFVHIQQALLYNLVTETEVCLRVLNTFELTTFTFSKLSCFEKHFSKSGAVKCLIYHL